MKTFTTNAPSTTLVDVSHGKASQDYNFTAVATVGPETVRVRVKVDSYAQQSYAVAEILAADRTWTNLVNEPVGDWYANVPSPYAQSRDAMKEAAEDLADRLLFRAARIVLVSTAAAATR